MEAIIEENPDTHVSSGNGGNTGNSGNGEPMSSSGAASGEIDLFPNGVSDTGNRWEHGDEAIVDLAPDDLPAIPDRFKVLDIGGEKVPLSGQWVYRDKQGKFLVYAHRMEEIIEENPDTHVSSGDGEQEWADYLNKLEAGAEVMPFDAWEEK